MIKITKKTEKIPVYDIEVKDNHNFFANGLCVHNCEISVPSHSLDNYRGIPGELGTCILGNINFGHSKESDIPKAADFLVRFLDNMIDISDFAMPEIEYSATKRRTLGIGVSNLFGYLAKAKLFYNTKEAREHINDLMELFYYNLVKTSIELAKERGACELYNESYYSDNKFIFERYLEAGVKPEFKPKLDWESLRENLSKYGMRHSSLSAVPPAGNSSKPSSATPGIEPPRELVTIKTEKSSTVKQLVPFYKTAKKYYTTAWGIDFNNKDYLKLVSTIQRYVDQSISTNQYYNIVETKKVNIEDVIEEFIECFNLGVKSLYYANFRTTDDADGDQVTEGCGSGGCSV